MCNDQGLGPHVRTERCAIGKLIVATELESFLKLRVIESVHFLGKRPGGLNPKP